MLINLIQQGNIEIFIILIPCLVFSLCFHEFAHGFIAYKLGDNTAYRFGRLTLNPISHLDMMLQFCQIKRFQSVGIISYIFIRNLLGTIYYYYLLKNLHWNSITIFLMFIYNILYIGSLQWSINLVKTHWKNKNK